MKIVLLSYFQERVSKRSSEEDSVVIINLLLDLSRTKSSILNGGMNNHNTDYYITFLHIKFRTSNLNN